MHNTCICGSIHLQVKVTGFMYKLVFALVKVSIKLGNTKIMVIMTAIQEISLNIQDFSTVHMSIHT